MQRANKHCIIKRTFAPCEKGKKSYKPHKKRKASRTVHPQKNGIYRYIIANHSVRKTQKRRFDSNGQAWILCFKYVALIKFNLNVQIIYFLSTFVKIQL